MLDLNQVDSFIDIDGAEEVDGIGRRRMYGEDGGCIQLPFTRVRQIHSEQ
jgi:hypothetical protein